MIGHVRRFTEGRDADDNPIATWGDPETLFVVAAEPGASAELARSGRDVQSVVWTLTVRRGTTIGPRDVIIWQGLDYQVDGAPLDWTLGPWPNKHAKIQVALKRVTG